MCALTECTMSVQSGPKKCIHSLLVFHVKVCIHFFEPLCIKNWPEDGSLEPKRVANCVLYIYRVSQEECARLREGVPYVKLYRYNPKHLHPKLNGYGDNSQRKVWASSVSTYCTPSVTSYLSNAPARQLDIVMQ